MLFNTLIKESGHSTYYINPVVIDNISTYTEQWGEDGRLVITMSSPQEVYAFLYNIEEGGDFISWFIKVVDQKSLDEAISVIKEMRNGVEQDGIAIKVQVDYFNHTENS
jgi:hypothetical protein